MSEALENQGFNPKGVGSEVPKGSRAQCAVPCMPSLRALQLFSASLQRGSVGPGGRALGQVEQAGCTGSAWS
eukprot:11671877-Alexandrium_andersonii.AAC.1